MRRARRRNALWDRPSKTRQIAIEPLSRNAAVPLRRRAEDPRHRQEVRDAFDPIGPAADRRIRKPRNAAFLAQHPELKIHVIGHTDNVPIRGNARLRFPTNWELSTARALAAVRFLTERAGVDPRRLGAVGYGEYRPVADNSTPEGRARNRRIAITILPDELAVADTAETNAPAATPPADSNPPAATDPVAK